MCPYTINFDLYSRSARKASIDLHVYWRRVSYCPAHFMRTQAPWIPRPNKTNIHAYPTMSFYFAGHFIHINFAGHQEKLQNTIFVYAHAHARGRFPRDAEAVTSALS